MDRMDRMDGMDIMDRMDGSAIKLAHYERCGMRVPGPTCTTQRVNDRNASGAINLAPTGVDGFVVIFVFS